MASNTLKNNQNNVYKGTSASNTSDVSVEMTKSFRNQPRGIVKPPKLSYKSGNSVDII